MNHTTTGSTSHTPLKSDIPSIRFGDIAHAVLPYLQTHGYPPDVGTSWLRDYLMFEQRVPKDSFFLSYGWLVRALECWYYVVDILSYCEKYHLEPIFLGRRSSDLLVFHDVHHAYIIEFKTRSKNGSDESLQLSKINSRQQVLENTSRLRDLRPDIHIYGYVVWFEYSKYDSTYSITPEWEWIVEYFPE